MRETLAFHITVLYRDFLAYTNDELKKLGLSFGLMPLILYTGKHAGCTQADLTKSLKLDWGYSQRSIAKLVSHEFMKKECDSKKSGNRLSLTEKGENAFNMCHSFFRFWDQIKTETLTPEEKETLVLLLSKMTAGRKES